MVEVELQKGKRVVEKELNPQIDCPTGKFRPTWVQLQTGTSLTSGEQSHQWERPTIPPSIQQTADSIDGQQLVRGPPAGGWNPKQVRGR